MSLIRSTVFTTCAVAVMAAGGAMAETMKSDRTDQDVRRVISTIADGDHRSDSNRARNTWRHPAQTLAFFGIRPDMTVVEIAPGGGWYTEILAPYLQENGVYYAGHYDPEHEREYYRNSVARYSEKLKSNPALYGSVHLTVFSPPDKLQAAPPESADMVVTFRNTHGWMRDGYEDAVFEAMYSYLKPGGILGLVQHRGDPDVPQDPKAASGYVREDALIEIAERAGFKLVARSEINANAVDSRNHPQGVWNLPPSYRDKDLNRAVYAAIGESDRMTLKFVKPE